MNSHLVPRLVSLTAIAAALVVLSGCGGVDRRHDRRDDRQERREERRDFTSQSQPVLVVLTDKAVVPRV